MDVFPVDWQAKELDDSFEILCYGKLQDGRSICVRVPFFPYFFVECPPHWAHSRLKLFAVECATKFGAILKYSLPVKRKTIWGFTNSQDRPFLQLAFPTLAAFKRARNAMTYSYKYKTFEASVDHVMRLFHVRNLKPAAWVRVAAWDDLCDLCDGGGDGGGGGDEETASRLADTDLEVRAKFTDLAASPDAMASHIPPLVLASWDIECYSASGAFPLAEKPGDLICTICTTFQRYGEPAPYLKHAATLHGCDPIPADAALGGAAADVQIESFDTEAEVINAWIDALKREQADVLLAWNSYGFDYKYVYGRSLICVDDDTGHPLVRLQDLGRATEGGGQPVQKTLSSAAYGDNNFFFLAAPGCLHLDLMQLVKKDHKLDSYALNAVADKFLGDRKMDLKPAEIFARFEGTNADRAVIVAYCLKDTDLPLRLMAKLSVFQNMLEMANATSVPVDFLITRGQQIKVFSLILKKARALGYLCPDLDRPGSLGGSGTAAADAEEAYEGATVLDAHRGAYLEDVVSALDFASLYPSIIRAHNMCPSTLVMDPRYAAVPGVEYYTIETSRGTYAFAQNVQSVLPALLDDLATFRTAAKRKMADAKAAGDAFQAAVWNGSQMAFKVSMNSAYGFFGASKGFLPCIPLALSVTTTGRHMIAETKRLVETLVPGSRVVYGDSVAEYTPLFVQRGDRSWITTFAALATEVLSDVTWVRREDGKESAECGDDDVRVWSDGGWTRLERLVRHAYDPAKGLVRVLTHTGLVDVTPDHSLVTANGQPVKPGEVAVGDVLLHADVPILTGPRVVTDPDLARIMGFHMGDGRQKIVPECILGAARSIRQAFLEGLGFGVHDADSDNDGIFMRIDPKSQLSASSIFTLLASLGHRVSFDCREDTPHIFFWISQSTTKQPKTPDAVKKIMPIAYDGVYVYDATTSNHHFAAGPGRLVVHNTDSVLCIFDVGSAGRTNVAAHFEVAQRTADVITKSFKHPNELEFEKCYYPYLLFSKKRYAGMLFSTPEAPDYMDCKGIQLVRRDNCPLVRTVSSAVLHTIMDTKTVEAAVRVAKDHILRVLRNEEALASYVVSKALKSEYKNPDSQPHLQVAKKIGARRGYPVPSGERVPFVFVESAENPDGLQAQRAEDPAHAEETGLVIDRLHYLDSQLAGPIETLLDVLCPGTFAALMAAPDIKPLVDALRLTRAGAVKVAKRLRTNASNHQREITSFFMFRN